MIDKILQVYNEMSAIEKISTNVFLSAKKYAFVSDYARFDILYQYGGVYFDTDVEVIKPIDVVIAKGSFAGMWGPEAVASGLGLAALRQELVYAEILPMYKDSFFYRPDGSIDFTTVVDRISILFKNYGLKNNNKIQYIRGITIYPIDYFNSKNPQTGIITITDNAHAIHHFAASWTTPLRRRYMHLCK